MSPEGVSDESEETGIISADLVRQHAPETTSLIACAAGQDAFVTAMR